MLVQKNLPYPAMIVIAAVSLLLLVSPPAAASSIIGPDGRQWTYSNPSELIDPVAMATGGAGVALAGTYATGIWNPAALAWEEGWRFCGTLPAIDAQGYFGELSISRIGGGRLSLGLLALDSSYSSPEHSYSEQSSLQGLTLAYDGKRIAFGLSIYSLDTTYSYTTPGGSSSSWSFGDGLRLGFLKRKNDHTTVGVLIVSEGDSYSTNMDWTHSMSGNYAIIGIAYRPNDILYTADYVLPFFSGRDLQLRFGLDKPLSQTFDMRCGFIIDASVGIASLTGGGRVELSEDVPLDFAMVYDMEADSAYVVMGCSISF